MKNKQPLISIVIVVMLVVAISGVMYAQTAAAYGSGGELLPPNAKPGECYARVFVPPTYNTVTETLLKKAASERVEIIPAKYEMVDETVLVKEASTRLVNVPTKYGTESDKVLVSPSETIWRTSLKSNKSVASDALLDAAKLGGINLASAQPGDCFHEHYVAPVYETVTEQVLAKAASERIEIVPAKYEMVEETMLVKEASTRLVNVPAKYGTESDKVLVSASETTWRTNLKRSSGVADNALLEAAKNGGINLATAQPGDCFHEHYMPPKYETVTEQVLVKAESDRVEIIPAKYEMAEEKVMVAEASSKLRKIPATYKWEEEKVLVKEAYTEWKQGRGLVEKVATTGEIMCLVEVPAVYRTVRKQVVETSARTETIEIPARYEMVKVRKLVSPASERRVGIPADYKTVSSKNMVSDGEFVWHEIHNNEHAKETRTGNQICLTEVPEKYRTDTKTVVVDAARTETVEIPAEYKTVMVRKLVAPASEKRIAIPAEYRTVSSKKMVSDGRNVWHEVHNMELATETRTGKQICLTQVPERYRTDTKTVVVDAARTETVEIPAEYRTLKVRKLAVPASEKRVVIPAEYQEITKTDKITDGYLQWSWVLCETNMTTNAISKIQTALNTAGFDVGRSDGVYGNQTASAIRRYQESKGLSTGGITKELLESLGITL